MRIKRVAIFFLKNTLLVTCGVGLSQAAVTTTADKISGTYRLEQMAHCLFTPAQVNGYPALSVTMAANGLNQVNSSVNPPFRSTSTGYYIVKINPVAGTVKSVSGTNRRLDEGGTAGLILQLVNRTLNHTFTIDKANDLLKFTSFNMSWVEPDNSTSVMTTSNYSGGWRTLDNGATFFSDPVSDVTIFNQTITSLTNVIRNSTGTCVGSIHGYRISTSYK